MKEINKDFDENVGQLWTEKELKYLAKHYSNNSNDKLARILKRSSQSITRKANELKIFKSKEYMAMQKKKLNETLDYSKKLYEYRKQEKKDLKAGNTFSSRGFNKYAI